MPRWSQIDEFPNYSISDTAEVRNDNRDRLVAVTQNQYGLPKVAISNETGQKQRSLPLLVARHFVEGESETFNTPIHLDGDQTNCHWTNLLWRPRWFAVQYHAQFKERSKLTLDYPLLDEDGYLYVNSWDAAIRNGLLEKTLAIATLNGDAVFPTGQKFKIRYK